MKQIYRHHLILKLLPSSRETAISTSTLQRLLADENVKETVRTLQRDMAMLKDRFRPAIHACGPPNQTLWWTTKPLSLLTLLPTDAMNLVMIMEHAARFGMEAQVRKLAPLQAYALSLLKGNRPTQDWTGKIISTTRFVTLEPSKVNPEVLEVIQQALLDDCSVVAAYMRRGATEPREILLKPLGLSYQDSNIYLSAIFKGLPAGSIAALPLHRFLSARETVVQLPAPPDYDIHSPEAQQSLISLETLTPVPLKLKISQRLYERLEENALSRDQNLTALDDGRWIWSGSLQLSQGLDLWLLSQGGELEVLEPLTLREKIAATARKMAALYEAD